MSRKHRKVPEPSVKTARDSRRAVHKYHKIDDAHSLATPAGRCGKCNKITDCYCDKCNHWVCKNHLSKNKQDLDVCEECLD